MDKEFSLKDRILVLTNEDFSKSLVLHEECGKAGQHEFESLPDAVDYAATIFSSVEPRSELEDLINELDNLLVALGASKDATYSYDAIAEYSKCAILTLVDGNRMVLIDNDVLLGYFAATVNDAQDYFGVNQVLGLLGYNQDSISLVYTSEDSVLGEVENEFPNLEKLMKFFNSDISESTWEDTQIKLKLVCDPEYSTQMFDVGEMIRGDNDRIQMSLDINTLKMYNMI